MWSSNAVRWCLTQITQLKGHRFVNFITQKQQGSHRVARRYDSKGITLHLSNKLYLTQQCTFSYIHVDLFQEPWGNGINCNFFTRDAYEIIVLVDLHSLKQEHVHPFNKTYISLIKIKQLAESWNRKQIAKHQLVQCKIGSLPKSIEINNYLPDLVSKYLLFNINKESQNNI